MPAEKIVTWKYGKFHFMSQNISKQLGLLARIRINCLEIQNEHCRNAKICINLQIRSLQHTHQSHQPSARHIWRIPKLNESIWCWNKTYSKPNKLKCQKHSAWYKSLFIFQRDFPYLSFLMWPHSLEASFDRLTYSDAFESTEGFDLLHTQNR